MSYWSKLMRFLDSDYEKTHKALKSQVDILETRFGTFSLDSGTRLEAVENRLNTLETRLEAVEEKVGDPPPPPVVPLPPPPPPSPVPSPPPSPPTPGPGLKDHRGWEQFSGRYDQTRDQDGISHFINNYYARFNLGQVMDDDGSVNLDKPGGWNDWFRLAEEDAALGRGNGKVAIRVMMVNPGSYSPTFLRDVHGIPGKTMDHYGQSAWHPDISVPKFQQMMQRLYDELAKYSDRIEYMDTGWAGISGGEMQFNDSEGNSLWDFEVADWMWSQDLLLERFPAVKCMCSVKNLHDHHNAAIACKYTVEQGSGIRIDGLDGYHAGWVDQGFFTREYESGLTGQKRTEEYLRYNERTGVHEGKSWLHGYVPAALKDMGVLDEFNDGTFWKRAPVAFEPSGYLVSWGSQAEYYVWHAQYVKWLRPAYFHNKGFVVPGTFYDFLGTTVDQWLISSTLEPMRHNRGNW